jgi:hypothetical protein
VKEITDRPLTSSSLELVESQLNSFDPEETEMATKTQPASERITAEVASWPGVEAGPGRRGEFAFTLGRRELGHLHGDHVFHGGFPKQVWQELFDAGRIDYHPVFPGKPGYASRRIETDEDVRDVIEMIRLNYERAVEHHGLPEGVASPARPRSTLG